MKLFWQFSLLASVFLVNAHAFSLTADRKELIDIEADTAIVDDANGSSIYRGNVIIEQGTLKIEADEVEIISTSNEVVQIIASTNVDSQQLAHYQQLPDDRDELIYADARQITYLVQEERIHLSGEATLKQTKDILRGDLIHYDINQGIVDLKSTEPDTRVKMTIIPKDQ